MRHGCKLITLLGVICFIVCGCMTGGNVPTSISGISQLGDREAGPTLPPLSPGQYVGELDSILSAIDAFYAHKESKQVDIQEMRAEFEPRVRAANDMAELNLVLTELFGRLQNGHAMVYSWTDEYGVSALCSLVEDRLTITKTGQVPELRAVGVDVGWVIELIDRQPAKDWLCSQFRLLSASNDGALWLRSTERVFLRYSNEPAVRSYLLRSPSGDLVEVEVALTTRKAELPWPSGTPVAVEDLGQFGYIAINTMVDATRQFDPALKGMLAKEGIILDLRSNGGGNSAEGAKMLRRLIQKDTATWFGTAQPYPELNYSKPVVALIGPYTFSAAESFAFDLHDSGRVITMGEATAGDYGEGTTGYITSGGIRFRFPALAMRHSASGLPTEGPGLQPHVSVSQKYRDLLDGRDTALEAAKEKLAEMVSSK